MAEVTGVGINISNLDELIRRIDKYESHMQSLILTTATFRQTAEQAFSSIITSGIDPTIAKLRENKSALDSLANMNLNGASDSLKTLAASAGQASDGVKTLLTQLTEISQRRAPITVDAASIMGDKGAYGAMLKHEADMVVENAKKKIDAEREVRRQKEADITAAFEAEEKKERDRLAQWLANKHAEAAENKRIEDKKFQDMQDKINLQNQVFERQNQEKKRQTALEQEEDTLRYNNWQTLKRAEVEEQRRAEEQKYQATVEAIRRQNEQFEIERQSRIATVQEQENQHKAKQREYDEMGKRLAEEDRAKRDYAEAEAKRIRENADQRIRVEQMIRDTERRNHEQKQRELQETFSGPMSASSLVSLKGSHSSLDELKAYAKELERTMNTLNPKSKEWKELNNILQQTNGKISNINAQMGKFSSASSGATNSLRGLGGMIASVFTVQRLWQYTQAIVTLTGEFEQMQVAMTTIIGNQEKANVIWEQTMELSQKSPFKATQLVKYTRQLAAYRIETEKLHGTTKMLADVSAGLGVDMSRLILAYGQVRAAEYLRGTELRQFTEAGVPMLEELSKHFTELEGRVVSTAEVFDMISKRKVNFEDVSAVLEGMTSDGGPFYKMQEQMANTVKGSISTLKNEVDLMMYEIGQSSGGMIKGFLSILKKLVQNWESIAKVLKVVVALYAGYQIAATVATIKTGAFAAAVAGTAKGTNLLTLSLAAATRGLKAFSAAFLSSPFGWIMLAISAIAGAIWAISDASDEAAEKEKQRAEEIKEELEQVAEAYKSLRDRVEGVMEVFDDTSSTARDAEIALLKLIDIARDEYHMTITVDINGASKEELKKKAEELSEDMMAVGTDAESLLQEWEKKWQTEKIKFTRYAYYYDIEDLGDYGADQKREIKDDDSRYALWQITDYEAAFDESMRKIMEFYNNSKGQMMKVIRSKDDEFVKALNIENVKTSKELARYMNKLAPLEFIELYYEKIQDSAPTTDTYRATIKEVSKALKGQFATFADEIVNFEGFISEKENIPNAIQSFLNFLAEDQEVDPALIDTFKIAIEEKLGRPLEIVDNSLQDWQLRFNEFLATVPDADFSGLSEEFMKKLGTRYKKDGTSNYLGRFLEEFTAGDKKSLEAFTKDVKSDLDAFKKTIKEYDDAMLKGSKSIHTEDEYKFAKEGARFLDIVYTYLAGGDSKEESKRKNAAEKLLKKRIDLIKKMHKQYLDEFETFGARAEQVIAKAYEKAFYEAFEGTGIKFTGRVIDESNLEGFVNMGTSAGEVFSQEVYDKLEEMKISNYLFRDLDDAGREAALEFIKGFEGSVNNAYQDIGSKKWAIGIGNNYDPETGKAITADTVWSDEDIIRKNKIAMQSHMDALNKILDLHSDIYVTEEQYIALLDMAWQTGGAAALGYAKDRDKFKKWLEEIDEMPIVKVLSDGTRNPVGIFDIDVDKIMAEYDAAATAVEKVAIAMEYVGIRNKVDQDTTEFMLKRGRERAAMFKGDLEVAQMLEKSSVAISNIDFTNAEGVVKALRQLMPLAKKEGEEAVLVLEEQIAEFEAKVGLEIKKKEDERVLDEIQETFNKYELTLELKKLNVPPDLAKTLLNFEYLNFDEFKTSVLDAATSAKPMIAELGLLANQISSKFNGNVDIINNKMIPSVELLSTEWGKILEEQGINDFSEKVENISAIGIQWGVNDAQERSVSLLVNPILPDGTILSEDELGKYIDENINGAEDILKADTLGVILSVNPQDGDASALFDVQLQYQELVKKSQEMQNTLIAELNKNISEIDWTLVGKALGGKQAEEIKNKLEEINKMADKLTRERMAKYIQYSRDSLGEAAKIRLEQIQKLAEIEEAFEEKDGDTPEAKETKKQEKQRAKDKAKKDADESLAKLNWENFKKSETFTSLMDDLSGASDDLLKKAIEDLEAFKKQWEDLPVDQMQEVVKLINKAKRAQDSEDGPWAEAKRLKGEISKDGRTREEAELASYNAEMENIRLQEELQMIELIQQQRNAKISDETILLAIGEKYKDLLGEEVNLTQRVSDITKKMGENQTTINNAQDRIQNEKDLIKQYEKQKDTLDQVDKLASDLYGSFKSLYEAVGGDGEDALAVFADMGMTMLSTVLQTIALSASLKTVEVGAYAVGTALNTAMGVIGWIVMAIQLVATAVSTIVNYADKQKEKEIESLAKKVEDLKEDFEDLSEKIDTAWDTSQLTDYKNELDQTYQLAIAAQKAIIAAREDEKEVRNGETDTEEYKQWEEAKKELEEIENEYAELKKDIYSKATDGILEDVYDAAKEFTDAWYDAFKETGDGLSGLEENFEEMFMNLAKNQAAMQITSKWTAQWENALKKYVNDQDTELTADDAAAWAAEVKSSFPELNAALEAFLGTISEGFSGESGSLSELQKGIQGITEDTAQVLESLLNSMRLYVADTNNEIKNQTTYIKKMWTMMDNAVSGQNPFWVQMKSV